FSGDEPYTYPTNACTAKTRRSVLCPVCDLLCTKTDCVWVKAEEWPNKDLLTPDKILTDCAMFKPAFFNYPGDD
ncbi:unnamed protein product, partial [Ectocarpus sp. 4 AP-2014]